ncbi:unnamed protein product [Clonostachys solani]|uniref:Uncharacterized protein n=1 Tax=Clonostachys solani TaxID=160281 RepID=A0A9N9W2I7_9HYPO|nr:unnamed protein product [Clonostachys solani]
MKTAPAYAPTSSAAILQLHLNPSSVCNPMARPAEAAASTLIGSYQHPLLHPVISGVGSGLSVKRKEVRPRQEPREFGVVAVKVRDDVDDHGM